MDARVTEITGGKVTAATQRDKLLMHLLMEHGVMLDSLRADDLEDIMKEDWLPTEVKELLKLRISSAMNSTSKYTRLLNCIGPDGRLRGTRQYNGASRTGRSAGRIFNPLNLRRPTMKAADIELCIDMVRRRDVADMDLVTDNDLREVCSNGLRGLVIAPPGKKLVVSDWSNIEGRMAAWLAGEEWTLDAFRAFDTRGPDGKRLGPDLYKLIYSKSFGVLVAKVTDFQRQIGKGEELSLQYGGGVGAFIAVSYAYGLDMDELARVIPTVAPYETLAQARAIYAWALKKGKTLGLSEEVYVACETVKLLYRAANPKIAQAWTDLENAARLALSNPGQEFPACRCTFQLKADYLMIKLPSGKRWLMYPTPRIMNDETITYAGSVHKQWKRIKTYGGKLLENITQAASRDILTHNMLRVDDEFKAQIVLDVYDEIVCEVDERSPFNLKTLNGVLTTNPPWATGLPLAAEGFEAHRYAKH
jgi:DNA polymerase